MTLVRQIGEGGMGVVWLARHDLLAMDVAVKLMSNVVLSADDPGLSTFLEGARAVASIRHAGINPILHADAVGGVPYLVMEHINGPTVSGLMRECGRLPIEVVLVVMEAVLEAVGVLHEAGVIHRDLKPSNVMVKDDGTVVVTDFGLACARSTSALMSTAEGVAGTPAYMAPEMFSGSISARTDVYALGVTLFEMLAGNVPYEGRLEELKRAHAEAPVPAHVLEGLGVDDGLVRVVERAMDKNVVFRYKTARHMLDSLVEATRGVRDPVKGKLTLQRLVSREGAGGARGEEGRRGEDEGSRGEGSGGEGSRGGSSGGGGYYDHLSTLASTKRTPRELGGGDEEDAGVEEEWTGLSVGRVEREVGCIRCGYGLKGLLESARCPSCFLLVSLTLKPTAEVMAECVGRAGAGAGRGTEEEGAASGADQGGSVAGATATDGVSGVDEGARAAEAAAVVAPAKVSGVRVRRRWSRWRAMGVVVPVLGVAFVLSNTLAIWLLQFRFDVAEALGLLEATGPGTTVVSRGNMVAGVQPVWWTIVTYVAVFGAAFFVPALLALGVYHRLVFCGAPADGVTRCGSCGYALAGLRELRCPECGRKI